MTTPNSDLIGVTNGANPLLTVVPTFSVKSIQQSTPVSGAPANTMTVKLNANCNLEEGSTVAITVLTGAVATGTITLSRTDAAKISVSSTTLRGGWTTDTLTLTVHAGLTLAAASPYTFTFPVHNPSITQSSPVMSVSANVYSGGSSMGLIAVAEMTKPGTSLYGVQYGYAPLLVAVPTFSVMTIQQSTPVSLSLIHI